MPLRALPPQGSASAVSPPARYLQLLTYYSKGLDNFQLFLLGISFYAILKYAEKS